MVPRMTRYGIIAFEIDEEGFADWKLWNLQVPIARVDIDFIRYYDTWMSALASAADIQFCKTQVRFVPRSDIGSLLQSRSNP